MKPKPINTQSMSLAEIRREGFRALLDRLGPAGTARFLQQYDQGRGDYTQDRHEWLDGLSEEELVASIKQRQGNQ